MNIVHVCMEQPYIDNWGYQENILPKYHKQMGYKVTVIASRDMLPSYLKNKLEYISKPKEYVIEGVNVVRLNSTIRFLNKFIYYKDLMNILNEKKPEIIYLHGGQSLSLLTLVKYKKNKGSKLIIDFHSDYGNSRQGIISRNILHKTLWRTIIKKLEKHIDKIYCITPWVKKFVVDMYNIEENKIDMIYLAADDEKVDFNNKEIIRRNIRENLSIKDSDKVLISGGKINKDKNIKQLIEAFNEINNESTHLIIFGTIEELYLTEIEGLIKSSDRIHYMGWLNSEQTYNHYLASDIAVFPGTQSVLWQQAIYCGLPLIIKKWPYGDYLNEGNVIFLDSDSIDEVVSKISYIIDDDNKLEEMSKISIECGQKKFSYKNIAEKIFE